MEYYCNGGRVADMKFSNKPTIKQLPASKPSYKSFLSNAHAPITGAEKFETDPHVASS